MTTLASLPTREIQQLINFGEVEIQKHNDTNSRLKQLKLRDKIIELVELYYTYADDLSERVKDQRITVKEFEISLIKLLRELYSFIVIETKPPITMFVEEMEYQIGYVLRYGLDIEKGRIGRDDRINYRTSLYVFSAWVFYQTIEQYWSKSLGKTMEKIICEAECGSEKDWQPIGTTRRINEESIGKKCWCEYQFK